jgi:signal transduction histidine kinase
MFMTSAVWTLLVLPLAGLLIYSLYRADVQTSFDGQLQKLVIAMDVDSMATDGAQPVAPTNRYEPLFEVPDSGWYWQIKPVDGQGGPVLASASLGEARLPSPYELGYPVDPETNTRWRNDVGPDGERVRIVEVLDTLRHDQDAPRYSVIVAGPLEWFETSVVNFRNRLTLALALVGLGLTFVTLFQIRFGLAPLKRVQRALSEIRSGQAKRLEGNVPTEIEPLREELNALIQANLDIVERSRAQVGNLAHALKTPLAVITNEAREHKSPAGDKIAEQAKVMGDQINHYLDRARMAARVSVISRSTAVLATLEPLVRALERIHRDKGVSIAVDCPSDARFQGEKQDLEEMLGNLLDNAAKWSRGRVYLSVVAPRRTGRPRSGRLKIVVEDDGPGLTAEQRARIGRRGLRLDETKPGSGLGLSIVIDLAQSYRGSVELDQSGHGGLLVRLELPSA